jgi:hypothetical protein
MEQPFPAVVKKIQSLAKIAADLRQGQHFNITRLTIIKGLCSNQDAAARFVVYIAKLAQRQFKARSGFCKPTPSRNAASRPERRAIASPNSNSSMARSN